MSKQWEPEKSSSQRKRAMNAVVVPSPLSPFYSPQSPPLGNGPLLAMGVSTHLNKHNLDYTPPQACPEGHLPSDSMILDLVKLKTNTQVSHLSFPGCWGGEYVTFFPWYL